MRVPNGTGRRLRFEAERRKCTGRLTNGPLHGMKPVAAIGDMSRPQVLAGGQQVLDALGYQSAQRNLERQGADVDVIDAASAGVKVNPV